jgi:hypothetical protein
MLLAVLAQAEEVEPLTAGKILLVLGLILVICFAIVIAGLGYFSPGDDK